MKSRDSKSQKSMAWGSPKYRSRHFSAENISFKIDEIERFQKSTVWEDPRIRYGHFSAENISFKILKSLKPFR
jgi:hypothetical protein